jgi:hypothetical protein
MQTQHLSAQEANLQLFNRLMELMQVDHRRKAIGKSSSIKEVS